MKALTGVFWAAVAGVVLSFVGAVVSVVKEKDRQGRDTPRPIVTPATLPPSS